MDFSFFESLSADEARSFLHNFIDVESKAVNQMISVINHVEITVDYGVKSLSMFLKWVLKQINTLQTEPDNSLPDWILGSDSYAKGLFNFDEQSKILILRAAYFWGESFVRSFPSLSWSIGNQEFMQINMPVVQGFKNNIEMPPLMIIENLFRRILSGEADDEAIDKAIMVWINDVDSKKKIRTKK